MVDNTKPSPMPLVRFFAAPVREFFTLSRAEAAVRGYVPERHARATAYARAGDRRASAGRRALDEAAAALLLREALKLVLLSTELARGTDGLRPLSAERLAELLPAVPVDVASPQAGQRDDALVRRAVLAEDELYLDGLGVEDLERTRWALDRAFRAARARVETRSVTHLRGLRWGRFFGVIILMMYAVLARAHARLAPVDVALGKPVHASSRRPATPDGHELVDGDVGTSFAVHTNTENNPSVVIDLQGLYAVDSVVVHNRVDGWFDDCLPLVLEFSIDGVHYDEVARREQHFDANPPWVAPARGHVAHFVRLRVPRYGYLALSEVEVFGKPRR